MRKLLATLAFTIMMAIVVNPAYSDHVTGGQTFANQLFCETVEDSLEIIHLAHSETPDADKYTDHVNSEANTCFDVRSIGLSYTLANAVEKVDMPSVIIGQLEFELWKVKLLSKVNTRDLYTWASHKHTGI